MHCDGLGTDFDFPFVAHIGGEVIKNSEFFQGFVPPIDDTVSFVEIFVGDLGGFASVILRVAAHEDFGSLLVDGGVASTHQDFVVPLRTCKRVESYATVFCNLSKIVPTFGILVGFQRAARHNDGKVRMKRPQVSVCVAH